MTDKPVSRLMDTISQVEERLTQLKAEHSNIRTVRQSIHGATDELVALVLNLETTNALLKEAADVSRTLNMEGVLGRLDQIGSDLKTLVSEEQAALTETVRSEALASKRMIVEGIDSSLKSAEACAARRAEDVTRGMSELHDALLNRIGNLESRLDASTDRIAGLTSSVSTLKTISIAIIFLLVLGFVLR